MNGIKTAYRTEFPRVGRALFIEAETGKAAIVRVTNVSTGQIVRSKRFEDYNEAMNYYSAQFNNLKSAEEYEIMRTVIETMVSAKE